jgi:hypothetical protein
MILFNRLSVLSILFLINNPLAHAQNIKVSDKADETIDSQLILQEKNDSKKNDGTSATMAKNIQVTESKGDISNFLKDAVKAYNEDNIFKALSAMQQAEEVVRGIQSKQIQILLPTSIDGWQISDEEAIRKHTTKGISVASRVFSDGIDEVQVSILIDSPQIDEMIQFASQSDKGVKNGIGDYNGYIKKFYRSDVNNRLAIVVGMNALVEIEGYQLSHTNALKIADFVNLNAINDFCNK